MGRIRLDPTPLSIEKRWLEWMVPDNAYNRMMAANHYGSYRLIESDIDMTGNANASEEALIKAQSENDTLKDTLKEMQDKLSSLSKPIDPKADVEKTGTTEIPPNPDEKPLNNMQKKEAKDALKAKLNAAGKTFPPTASLPMLQELAAGL